MFGYTDEVDEEAAVAISTGRATEEGDTVRRWSLAEDGG